MQARPNSSSYSQPISADVLTVKAHPRTTHSLGQVRKNVRAVSAIVTASPTSMSAGRLYTTSDDAVSPAEAARMLGVSRQYVDRLIVDGRLPFGNKPGSTHRTILVADVERLASQRSRRQTNSDKAINALLDGGLDY